MAAVLGWDFKRGSGSNSAGGFGYIPEDTSKATSCETTLVRICKHAL